MIESTLTSTFRGEGGKPRVLVGIVRKSANRSVPFYSYRVASAGGDRREILIYRDRTPHRRLVASRSGPPRA